MSVGRVTVFTWCVTLVPLMLLSHAPQIVLALPTGVRFAGVLLYTVAITAAAAYAMHVAIREFRLFGPYGDDDDDDTTVHKREQ